MASALGIDLGNVYRTVEAVKASRATRGAQETATENALATQTLTREAAANAIANPTDPKALAAVAILDPTAAKTLGDIFTAADETKRAELDRQNDILAQTAAAVLEAEDPAAAYQQFRGQLPAEAQAGMPATFDANWVKLQLARATEVDKLYESLNSKATAEVERTNELADDATDHSQAIELEGIKRDNAIATDIAKAETEGTSGALKAADANAIFRYSAELFGGIFDSAGNLQNLDPGLRAKVAEVATRAESYMIRDKLPHLEAVKKAAAELGVAFPGSTPGPALGMPAPAGAAAPANPADPLGLFN